jgi:hypothetical protein
MIWRSDETLVSSHISSLEFPMVHLVVRRALLLTVMALFLPIDAYAQRTQRPFDPVGRWRFFHADGSPFTARLTADQHADTDAEGGEHGLWRWEGSAVRLIYTDGWDDLLVPGPNGTFAKRGWSPEGDRCVSPSNETRAEHLSTDPGPPL